MLITPKSDLYSETVFQDDSSWINDPFSIFNRDGQYESE